MKTKALFTKIVLAFLCVCVLLGGVFVLGANPTTQAFAAVSGGSSSGKWTTSQKTNNLIPDLSSYPVVTSSSETALSAANWSKMKEEGWGASNVGKHSDSSPNLQVYKNDDGGLGIRPAEKGGTNYDANLGAAESYTGGIYYTVALSAADKVKANLGQLTVTSSAKYWNEGARYYWISARAQFLNASGQEISEASVKGHDYDASGDQYRSLTLAETVVPVNTAYVRFWYSNTGKGNGRKHIGTMTAYMYDKTAPSFASASLIKTDVVDSANNVAITGNPIKYSIKFNEKVSLTSKGTAYISLGGNSYMSSTNAKLVTSSGVSAVEYTFVLDAANTSGTIALSSVSGLKVTDEAGNATTYSDSPSAGTIQYYKQLSVSNSLTKLSSSGGSTANYGTNYSATLTPSTGYHLPSSISVAVGGNTLSTGSSTYTYDATTGAISIDGKAIKGDIVITATGVANTYSVVYDKNKPASATADVQNVMANSSHTYDAEKGLSANTYTLNGWSFQGWATSADGEVAYANGESVKNLTAVNGGSVTLYAVWKANTYTVKYEANKPTGASANVQGSTASSSHTYDTAKALTSNGFTLNGWSFQGWATSAGGAVSYTNGESVKNLTAVNGGSVTLYAVWKANTYTVKYEANKPTGASANVQGSTASSSHTYDTAKALTSNGFTLNGWTFKGWAKTASGAVSYTNGESVKNLTKTNGGSVTLYAVWEANTYTVNYHSNQPTGASSAVGNATPASTHTYDTAKALTNNGYTLNGWSFQGWAKTADGEVFYQNGESVKNLTAVNGGNVTLYAVWKANEYTVVYDTNKPSTASDTVQGNTPSSAHTYDTENTLTSNGYTLLGWTFLGWAETANGGVDYTDEQAVKNLTAQAGESVTLYAVWKANEYTVGYDGNKPALASASIQGAMTPSSHVYDTGKALSTNGYTLTGWSFQGWAETASGEVVYQNGETVKSLVSEEGGHITLYAVWKANEYTIIYDANKPTSASDEVQGNTLSSTHVYDSAKPLTKNGYTLLGWTFLGWATSESGTVVYTDEKVVNNLTAVNGDTITVYAVWEANDYKITFSAMGGSGSGEAWATYDHTLPTFAAPLRNGYSFQGYYTEENGGGERYYTETGAAVHDKDYEVDGALQLYAYWLPIVYSIKLYSEGTYVDVIDPVVYGELYLPTAADLGISKKNFDFVGWNLYDEQNWSMYNAHVQYSVGIATHEHEVVTLYAAWLEKPVHAINFDANGGVGAPMMSQAHEEETVVLDTTVPTREDYTFLGWATSFEASVPEYLAGGTLTMGENIVTLYAVWEHNPKLSYAPNGGEFTNAILDSYPAAGEIVTLSTIKPSKEGYVFQGWATSESASEAQYLGGGAFVMPSEDTTLYAVWDIERFTVQTVVHANYTVEGLLPNYPYGERVQFTIIGSEPRVYINGEQLLPVSGEYSFVITADSTLVVSDGNSYYLVYSSNGGVGAPMDTVIYETGNSANVSAVEPTREGYTFAGWATTNVATSADVGDTVTFADENVVLYAVWEEVSYTVQFDKNGGEGSMTAQSFAYDSKQSLQANAFTKEGYTFEGWATSADGNAAYLDEAQVLNLSATDGDSITLYAVWEQTVTQITFEANGGENGTEKLTVAYGDIVNADILRAPSKLGYRFIGYYTENNGAGDWIFDEKMRPVSPHDLGWAMNEETVTLYAYYLPVQYTVLLMNGDDTVATLAVTCGVSFDLPTLETLGIGIPEGYYFAGWSAYADSQTATYVDGQTINGDLSYTEGDIVYLYAIFGLGIPLAEQIDGVANDLNKAITDLNTAIANGDSDLNDKITAVDTAYQAADTLIKSDIANLQNNSVALQKSVSDLQTSMEKADDDLQKAIETVQDNLDKAVGDLNTAIANGDSDLQNKITAVDNAYQMADTLIKSDIANLQTNVSDLQTSMEKADDDLQKAIETVQDNLDKAVSDLNTAIANGDSYLNDKITAVDTAYQAADTLIKSDIANLQTNVSDLQTSMEKADDDLQKAIDTVQDNLDKAVTDLNTSIANGDSDLNDKITAVDTAYQAADTLIKSDIANLQTSVSNLQTSMEKADNDLQKAIETVQDNLDKAITDLNTAIANGDSDLQNKITAVDTAYQTADTLMKSDIASLQTSVSDLQTSMEKADDDLQKAIDAVQVNLDKAVGDLNTAIANGDSDLNDKITAVDEAYQAADTLIKSDIANLQTNVSDLQTSMEKADSDLQKAIETVQDNLDKAITDLNTAIANGDSDLQNKITAVDTAYQAADTLMKSDIANLQTNVSDLQTSMEKADEDLQKAIDAVQVNLDKAITDLNTAIANGDSDLNDKITAVDEALEAADTLMGSDIEALQNELLRLKRDYQTANAVVKASISKLQQDLTGISEDVARMERTNKIYIVVISVIGVLSMLSLSVAVIVGRKKR